MNDYISKQAAIDAIMGKHTDAHYPDWYAEEIKKLPSANVFEVVRCVDCKFYDGDLYCESLSIGTYENCFCCWGEKNE